ncbi:MAG: NADPH-dependent F420 reductase [Acidobacteria bacterium]|nr:NADPH-dependent F420 reductase [Acidobacteriota bacterium]MBK8148078.1 NADPH-dependent F420 reductase [Acidobacteriota bacterium]MBK8811900.1 NADPH-dependent F420 reductase [Acidobacteriota bacterium]
MKIAILGAGNVGAALGRRLAEVGHEVEFGVRNPAEPREAVPGTRFETTAEAAHDSEVIILAVPFGAVESALRDCGDIEGKIIVDATNPLTMTDKGLALTCGFDTSGAEQIAPFTAGANLVKCFNSTGFANMADASKSMMFVCGDDHDAVETVRKLAEDIGFEAIAIGDLTKSRLLEPLAMLWIHLAYSTDLKRDFAFQIFRR